MIRPKILNLNLNKLELPLVGRKKNLSLEDYGETSENIAVHFRDLDQQLVKYIRNAKAVVGAVYLLTHEEILEELAKKEFVSIVVQKAAYYRNPTESWQKKTIRLYKQLPQYAGQYVLSDTPSRLSSNDKLVDTWDAIRSVGVIADNNKEIIPFMHNKFLIFCDYETRDVMIENPIAVKNGLPESFCDMEVEVDVLRPYAVWTGSFNITKNALKSLENALYITDFKIVDAYYSEWGQLLAMSESLDGMSNNYKPQWEIEY
jgi:hypothetical protein